MMMSLRKSFRDTSAPSPEPKFQTLFAHFSNSVSWVTPRSSVMASYSVRPGDLRLGLGAPPPRCLPAPGGRLAAGAGVAALAVLDDLRRALEHADLADARHVAAVPLDPELEVHVRV